MRLTGAYLVFLQLLTYFLSSQALKCYQCGYMDSSLLGPITRLFAKLVLEPKCRGSDLDGVSVTSCDGSDAACFFLKGSATVSVLGSSDTVDLYIRGCVQVENANFFTPQCRDLDTSDLKKLNKQLGGLVGVNVDGKMCTCDGDRCDAKCTHILGYCLWSASFLVILAAIVLIVGLIVGCPTVYCVCKRPRV